MKFWPKIPYKLYLDFNWKCMFLRNPMVLVFKEFVKFPFIQVWKDIFWCTFESRKVFSDCFEDGLVIYIGIFMNEEIPHSENGLPWNLLVWSKEWFCCYVVSGRTSVQPTRFPWLKSADTLLLSVYRYTYIRSFEISLSNPSLFLAFDDTRSTLRFRTDSSAACISA